MKKYLQCPCLIAAAAALFSGGVRAQDTIPVQLDPIYASRSMAPNDIGVWINRVDPPQGIAVDGFQPHTWAEWRVGTTTPGLYKIQIQGYQSQDPRTVLAFETVRLEQGGSLYATRYASPDTKDYGQFSGNSWDDATLFWNLVDLGNMVDAGGVEITVPLWEGENLLRVQNVTDRHLPADYTDPYSVTRQLGGWWCNMRIHQITLHRAGDLPASGTVSGRVTADLPAGHGVSRAIVCVNEPGKSPAEINTFWKNGYYTFTRPDGTYSLEVPAGAREVMAGRPSGYQLPGSAKVNVSVTAGQDSTANPQLKSLFRNDLGAMTATVQNEYYDIANANMAILPDRGQNGMILGFAEQAGENLVYYVDAPQAGLYRVGLVIGGGEPTVRVTTDLGSRTEARIPVTVWNPPSHHDMPDPVYLQAGLNIITEEKLNGGIDFDALTFTLLPDTPTIGQVKGIVTDATTGEPVPGATVTVGTTEVVTDGMGQYNLIANPGSNMPFRVTHPYQDAPVTGVVSVTAGALTVRNAALVIRPHIDLTTANGYEWKVIPNVGSAADFSAEGADESAAVPYTVPANWDTLPNNAHLSDSIFGWYRLHFTVPDGFLTKLPDRMVVFQVSGIDDVDATYLNGQFIGSTGKFPSGTVPVREAGYDATPDGLPTIMEAGAVPAWNTPRRYLFPASLLKPGGNVLAVKVYDAILAGGIMATPRLVIAPPAGTVSGTVKAGTSGVPNARVTAMDVDGLASASTWTDATGAFTLTGVTAGPVILGTARPGYTAAVVPLGQIANGDTLTGVDIAVNAIADAPAPSFDEFNATSSGDPNGWEAKWDAVSELDPNSGPFISQPGYDVNDGNMTTIPGTITIDGGIVERSALISKARFTKYASVNAARLVSALSSAPEPTGATPNVILQLYGPPSDDPATYLFDNNVELDLEGYATVDGQQRVRLMVWANLINYTDTAVPIPLARLSDITPANPVDMVLCRTGTVYDFYVNGAHVYGGNLPALAGLPDHKVALYSYPTVSSITFDWVKAGPQVSATSVKGDLNRNGLLDSGDVLSALRIVAGLNVSAVDDIAAGDVTGETGIRLDDAERLIQAFGGKPL